MILGVHKAFWDQNIEALHGGRRLSKLQIGRHKQGSKASSGLTFRTQLVIRNTLLTPQPL